MIRKACEPILQIEKYWIFSIGKSNRVFHSRCKIKFILVIPVTYIFTFLRSPPYHEDESSSRNHKYPEKNTHLWLCKMGFRCSFLVDSPPILLISMKYLQKQFVDIWLALKSILDLVDIVDGMVELHRLMLSGTWSRMGLKICRSNLLLTWGERRLGGARDDREAGEGWGGCWYTKMFSFEGTCCDETLGPALGLH